MFVTRISLALICVCLALVQVAARPAPARVSGLPSGWPDTGGAVTPSPGPDRTLVTDPQRLAAMGFPPKAPNVYIHAGVLSNVRPPEAPLQDFGFGAGGQYTSIPAKAFIGEEHNPSTPGGQHWQYSAGDVDCCVSLSAKGTEPFADATITLPPGVVIQSVRYWASDTNVTTDMEFHVLEVCHPSASAGAVVTTLVASGSTSGSGGYQGGLLAGGPYAINNRDCSYLARLFFPATSGFTFQKLRVEWRRQVSPSPAVATFVDVPTSHFFFRWIEALAASGITAGCGPGPTYCPDNPVTRAQMAVFLSVALGLYAQ